YGSIGNEAADGMPKTIWDDLYNICPQPDSVNQNKRFKSQDELYAYFGFITEKDQELPIGFSKRKVSILGLPLTETERIGINCALCHTATYRIDHAEKKSHVVPGGPAHQFVAQEWIKFLTGCAESLTISHIIEEQGWNLFAWKNPEYCVLAPITRQG